MNPNVKYAVFDKRQTVLDSVIKDIISLATLTLMVVVSRDSNWWTLVTGVMYIAWMAAKVSAMTKDRYKTFTSKEDLKAWVDTLE